MKTNQTFGQAVEALNQGKVVSREGWAGKDLFVFRQVPSEVPEHIIAKMTSLPEAVRAIVTTRGLPLKYENQLAIVFPDNHVNGWAPSVSDALATDWRIHDTDQIQPEVEGHVVAGDTVGTATPLE